MAFDPFRVLWENVGSGGNALQSEANMSDNFYKARDDAFVVLFITIAFVVLCIAGYVYYLFAWSLLNELFWCEGHENMTVDQTGSHQISAIIGGLATIILFFVGLYWSVIGISYAIRTRKTRASARKTLKEKIATKQKELDSRIDHVIIAEEVSGYKIKPPAPGSWK